MSGRDDARRARRRRRAFAELEAHPRFQRLRRRAGRRRLLGAHVAWGAAGYLAVGTMAVAGVDPIPGVAAAVVWLVVFVVLTGWLNASVGGVTELPYDLLDEAQVSVRRRAESDAHRAVRVVLFGVGLLAVGGLGARVGSLAAGVPPEDPVTVSLMPSTWTWTLVAIAAAASLLALLPLYLLAWRLPDGADDGS